MIIKTESEITEDQLHEFVMPHGKHKDVRLVNIPVSYLKWMVNVKHQLADWAAAEMKRRGTVTPDIEISGHAINRASLLLLDQWEHSRFDNEGLHAWLCRIAKEAHEHGDRHKTKPGRSYYEGMTFQFALDVTWPVLKTIFPTRKRKGLLDWFSGDDDEDLEETSLEELVGLDGWGGD